MGYSIKTKFSLCQSIDACFRVFNVAPIILVNAGSYQVHPHHHQRGGGLRRVDGHDLLQQGVCHAGHAGSENTSTPPWQLAATMGLRSPRGVTAPW